MSESYPVQISKKSLNCWICGTIRRLEQLMMFRGLQNVKDNHNAQKMEPPHVRTTNSNGISSQKIKTSLFFSDKKKLEFLRGYCRGRGPKSYIGPWALSGDINWSEEKQMIIRCSQTKSRKQKANEKLSEEYILLGPTIYGSKSITQQLK